MLFPMIAIYVILGLVATLLLQNVFKRPAPFGIAAEYIIGVAASVAMGLLDYLVFMPLVGFQRPLWLALGSAAEAPFATWIVLWVLRQIKGTPPAE